MKKENKELVLAAVAYWSNFLKNQDSVVQDNGEPTQFAMMNMLAKLAGKITYPQEAIEDFEVELQNVIEVGLNRFGHFSLNVDYHPDDNLSKALNASIKNYNSMSIFPCKTNMSINIEENMVEVSEGYGKPWVKIYPVPEPVDNTELLEDGYNYVIFFENLKDVQIIINFKRYRCDCDVIGLGLDSDADSVKVKKVGDKFYVTKLLTKPGAEKIEKEIKVYDYIGELTK